MDPTWLDGLRLGSVLDRFLVFLVLLFFFFPLSGATEDHDVLARGIDMHPRGII